MVVGADEATNTGTDSGTDTGIDTGIDTGNDTGIDTGTDTVTDTVTDTFTGAESKRAKVPPLIPPSGVTFSVCNAALAAKTERSLFVSVGLHDFGH